MTTKKAETPPNIHQRMRSVMQAVSYVQKNKPAGMKYSVVSHDAVTAKIRPALVENGIVYYPDEVNRTQSGNRTEVDLFVRFVNVDNPEDFIRVPASGYGCDNQDKGPGKAISYAVKYALLKAFGLETGDDADNEEVMHEPTPRLSVVIEAKAQEFKDTMAGFDDTWGNKTFTDVIDDLSTRATKEGRSLDVAFITEMIDRATKHYGSQNDAA